MKIKIILLVFLFFTVSIFLSSISSAEEAPVMDLDRIVISAHRIPTDVEDSVDNIEVYPEEFLEQLPAENLGEALHYIPGVDVSIDNGFGQAKNLSIYGSQVRHVLVAIDGIPMNTQLSGQTNLSRIPVEIIQRIEVIKGPASSVWGSSLGGVVNVITKQAPQQDGLTGNLTATFAEFQTFRETLNLGGRSGKIGFFFSGGHMISDGIETKSRAEETKFFQKVHYDVTDDMLITGSFGYTGAQINDGVNPNNRWFHVPYNTRFGKLQWDLLQDEQQWHAAYKYNDQDVTSDIYNATTDALLSSTIGRNVFQGLSLNGQRQIDEHCSLVLGADFDWHRIKSNNYLDTAKHVAMQSPYANVVIDQGPWSFIPGLRYDHNNRFGDQFSPSFGVAYKSLSLPDLSMHAKVSRAFNAPPLTWIYNEDPVWLVAPNPDLTAERGIVYEIGINKAISQKCELRLHAYRADIKDAIAVTFNGTAFQSQNFKKFRRQGVELIWTYDVSEEWRIFGSGAFNDVENRETKKTVRDASIARQSYQFGVNYQYNDEWFMYLSGFYKRWSSAPSLEPNDRKVILDLSFRKKFKQIIKNNDVDVFLNIHNLTNSKYWSNINSPLPGRYFEGGCTLSF
jgi:vitamin B12 transporter